MVKLYFWGHSADVAYPMSCDVMRTAYKLRDMWIYGAYACFWYRPDRMQAALDRHSNYFIQLSTRATALHLMLMDVWWLWSPAVNLIVSGADLRGLRHDDDGLESPLSCLWQVAGNVTWRRVFERQWNSSIRFIAHPRRSFTSNCPWDLQGGHLLTARRS